jgi:hypothetical protein
MSSFILGQMLLKENSVFRCWMCVSSSKMKPEERVNAAIYMSDMCVSVCASSVKDQNQLISEKELLKCVRKRINLGRRRRGVV